MIYFGISAQRQLWIGQLTYFENWRGGLSNLRTATFLRYLIKYAILQPQFSHKPNEAIRTTNKSTASCPGLASELNIFNIWNDKSERKVKPIKGLKETTHGYKKNETKRMISRANCNTMFLFFAHRRQSDFTKSPLMISQWQCEIMISRLV